MIKTRKNSPINQVQGDTMQNNRNSIIVGTTGKEALVEQNGDVQKKKNRKGPLFLLKRIKSRGMN